MKEQFNEIDNSIFEGLKIFNELKNCKIKLDDNFISINDKKYLSLYLGLINSENKVSELLKNYNFNIHTSCKELNEQKYKEILNMYFLDIFSQVNFETIEDYLNFLLNKKIIKVFNKINSIDEKIFNQKNKTLIYK